MAAKKKTPEDRTGRDLLAAGCRQGVLVRLPLALASWAKTPETGWDLRTEGPREISRPWVVATQDCDLAAPGTTEPNVELLGVEECRDPARLGNAARGNSSRVFLLSRTDDHGLLALAGRRLMVEKASLLGGVPFEEVMAPATLARFAPWLAGRYQRPALEDDLVELVVRPLVKAVDTARRRADPIAGILDRIVEIRMQALGTPGPREVHLLLLSDPEGALTTAERASLEGWLLGEVFPAPPSSVEIRHFREIDVETYLATVRIPLDHFSED